MMSWKGPAPVRCYLKELVAPDSKAGCAGQGAGRRLRLDWHRPLLYALVSGILVDSSSFWFSNARVRSPPKSSVKLKNLLFEHSSESGLVRSFARGDAVPPRTS